MNNPCLEMVTAELDRAGVRYRIEQRRRHIRVWFKGMFVTLATSPSDHRAPKNARSLVRRMLAGEDAR